MHAKITGGGASPAATATRSGDGGVRALVGGLDYGACLINRATDAARQPGSSFKPFVYAAALEGDFNPTSIVLDAPISFAGGANGGRWTPENYSREYYGPQTLRRGLELSRNVMTVRLAQDMGMPLITEYSRRFGVYDDRLPGLSMSLGAGETTVMRGSNIGRPVVARKPMVIGTTTS